MASSIVMFEIFLSQSITLIYLRITLVRYFAFNDRITPSSIGYVTEVVFGGKEMRSMTVNPGTSGCAGQLLIMNAILRFWTRNIRSKCFIQSLKISVSIQLFGCPLHWHGKDFAFLKHLEFLLFPMTSNGSFSPVALTVHIPVSLTLLCLPSLHFSFQFQSFVW